MFLRHDRENRICNSANDGDDLVFLRDKNAIKLKYANINTEDFIELNSVLKEIQSCH
jgi:hypothetical protein